MPNRSLLTLRSEAGARYPVLPIFLIEAALILGLTTPSAGAA